MTDELFDVVNNQDQVVGTAPRGVVHAQGLLHRAVHVLLFNRSAELFIQKRSSTKDTYPRCYDSSASGHLDTGETYDQCAVRELHEELGLNLSPDALTKQFKLAACAQTGWEFVWVYSLQGNHRPVINPEEIESGRFWIRTELQTASDTCPDQFAPCFRLVLAEVGRRGLWPAADEA
jgi:isopentenyl-diphosphate delta-isomerase type 1